MDHTKNKLLLATLAIVAFFAFLKLGQDPLHDWDESRGGINALEMLGNQDWVNLHFRRQPDDWRAKPPLFIWSVALSFKSFGASEFSLRLPSALSIVVAFFFVFRLISLYRPPRFAFLTCLILCSVNGLIGFHVGKTGDFDAMLTAFLMAGLYFFLQWFDFGKTRAVLWTGLFWGLAFMVKGPAMLVLVPGVLLYALAGGRLKKLLLSKDVWLAGLVAFVFPVLWFFLIQNWGVKVEQPRFVGVTAFERLFLYDIVTRFSAPSFENNAVRNGPDFFLFALDKTFNLWSYVFFGSLLSGAVLFFKKSGPMKRAWLLAEENRLLVLSICLWLPLLVFLTFGAHSNRWYLAPVIPFIGITTSHGVEWLIGKQRKLALVFGLLLAFTLGRKSWEMWNVKDKPAIIADHQDVMKAAPGIVQVGAPPEQDILLYLYLLDEDIRFTASLDYVGPGEIAFINKTGLEGIRTEGFEKIGEDDKYLILRKKE